MAAENLNRTADSAKAENAEAGMDIAVDEILTICNGARTIALKAGEVLFREGDDAHAMYVVNTARCAS